MTHPIFPCLWFNGQAKAAAEFYSTVFGYSKILQDTPMVVTFELNNQQFMGLNGGPMFTINPSISFFITSPDLATVNKIWNKLLEGGETLMPIDAYPWSERYGWVKDQFDVTWQVMIDPQQTESEKITTAFLFTKNQFGKAHEAVHLYSTIFPASTIDVLEYYPEGEGLTDKLMYSSSHFNGQRFIAMDGPNVEEYEFSEGVSLVVACDTQDEIDFYWNKLIANGGAESMCGWLKDKYGVSWQIVPAVLGKLMNNPEKGERVMKALLKMKKLDIALLLEA